MSAKSTDLFAPFPASDAGPRLSLYQAAEFRRWVSQHTLPRHPDWLPFSLVMAQHWRVDHLCKSGFSVQKLFHLLL